MNDAILFTLNGISVTFNAGSDRSSLSVLMTDYGLYREKYGCGEGRCGPYK